MSDATVTIREVVAAMGRKPRAVRSRRNTSQPAPS